MLGNKGSINSLCSLDASLANAGKETKEYLKNNKIYGLVRISNKEIYKVATSTKELSSQKEEDIVLGNDLVELLNSIRKEYSEDPDFSKIATHKLEPFTEWNGKSHEYKTTQLHIKKNKIPELVNLPAKLNKEKLEKLVKPFGTVKIIWENRWKLKELEIIKSAYDNELLTPNLYHTGRTGTLSTHTKTLNIKKKEIKKKQDDSKCLGLNQSKYSLGSYDLCGINLNSPCSYYPIHLSWNTDHSIKWKLAFHSTRYKSQVALICAKILPNLDFIVNNAKLDKARNHKERRVFSAIKAFRNEVSKRVLESN